MRLLKALGSLKLAAALIAALLALATLSVIVPQAPTLGSDTVAAWRAAQPWLAEPAIALGLTRIFYSWPYYVVSLALAVNLAFCTADRVSARRRVVKAPVGAAPDDALDVACAVTPQAVTAALRGGMRWYDVDETAGGVVCRSGRRGFAGSVLMHVGIIVLVIAGVVTGLTRFEGVFMLTEGLGAPDVRESYVDEMRVPRVGNPFTGALITLEEMEFDYSGPVVTESRARLSVDEAGGGRRSYVARVNYPLRVGAKSFLIKGSGLAAGIRVTDPSGTVLPDAMVNLGKAVPDGYADSAVFGGLSLGLLAVPDAGAPRGAEIAERYTLVDPAVVVSATVDGRQVVSDEMVVPGGSLEAGGWKVEVLEVRRWTGFNARVDHGMYVAYVGFMLAVLGAALRLLDPDRTVRVRLGDGRARVWARARWGSSMAAAAAERVAAVLGEQETREGMSR